MIGDAILEVSAEQMVQAFQEWLDRNWTVDSPVVTGIVVKLPDNAGYNSTDRNFTPMTFKVGLKSNREFVVGEPEGPS